MLWARVHGQARHTGPQVYWTCLADLTKPRFASAATRGCAWPWRTAP